MDPIRYFKGRKVLPAVFLEVFFTHAIPYKQLNLALDLLTKKIIWHPDRFSMGDRRMAVQNFIHFCRVDIDSTSDDQGFYSIGSNNTAPQNLEIRYPLF